jgi:hypothetical protein
MASAMTAFLVVAALAGVSWFALLIVVRGAPRAPSPTMARARHPVALAVTRGAVTFFAFGLIAAAPLVRSDAAASTVAAVGVLFLHAGLGTATCAALERWGARDDRAGRAMRGALVASTLLLVLGTLQAVYAAGALRGGPATGSADLHAFVAKLAREPFVAAVTLGALLGSFGLYWGVPSAAVLAARLHVVPRALPVVGMATLGVGLPGMFFAGVSAGLGDWLYVRLGGEWVDAPAQAG